MRSGKSLSRAGDSPRFFRRSPVAGTWGVYLTLGSSRRPGLAAAGGRCRVHDLASGARGWVVADGCCCWRCCCPPGRRRSAPARPRPTGRSSGGWDLRPPRPRRCGWRAGDRSLRRTSRVGARSAARGTARAPPWFRCRSPPVRAGWAGGPGSVLRASAGLRHRPAGVGRAGPRWVDAMSSLCARASVRPPGGASRARAVEPARAAV
jgi:hypothetical protein